MIWDLYDGPRSGIADFANRPHYFKCIFDRSADEYTESFRLFAIDESLLSLATEQWQIYREWEHRFHSGATQLETHPGHGGVHERYDELEREIKGRLDELAPIEGSFTGEFKMVDGQPDLPSGCLRELEVRWRFAA